MSKSNTPILELIEDMRIAQNMTRQELGDRAGLSKRRMDELINDGRLAKQFYEVMRVLEVLKCPPVPAHYFRSDENENDD